MSVTEVTRTVTLGCASGIASYAAFPHAAARAPRERVARPICLETFLRQLCVEPTLFHKHGRAEFDDTARSLTVASPGPKLRAALELVRRLVFEGHDKIVTVSEFVVRAYGLHFFFRTKVFSR